VHSRNLSLFDAHYSVAICASPLSAYVVFSSLLHCCGVKTFLFEKKILVANHQWIVAFFGVLLLLLWSVTSGVTSLSSTAYRNSNHCRHTTFNRWLEFIAVSTMNVFDVMGRRDLIDDLINRQGLGLVSLFCLYTWCIFIVRRREEIIKRLLELFYEVPNPAWARRVPASIVLRYLLMVIHIPRACW